MTAFARVDTQSRPALSRPDGSPAPFLRIVCAVDGGAAAQLAVTLAGPGIALDFLSVIDGRGFAAARDASLGPAGARRALDEAFWAATGARHPRAG